MKNVKFIELIITDFIYLIIIALMIKYLFWKTAIVELFLKFVEEGYIY